MTRDEAPRVMRLFDDPLEARAPRPLGPGAVLLPGFALPVASALLTAVGEVIAAAPLRHMIMSVGARLPLLSGSFTRSCIARML